MSEGAPPKRICPACGKEIEQGSHLNRVYCSTKCRRKKENQRYGGKPQKKYYENNKNRVIEYIKNYNKKHSFDNRARIAIHNAHYYQENKTQIIERIKNNYKVKRSAGTDSYFPHGLDAFPDWFEKPTQPLNIQSDRIILTSDWHIPFDKPEYVKTVFDLAHELDIYDIAIIGDFWDCDNYSRYTRYNLQQTFQDEIKHVTHRLKLLTDHFDGVYFCPGNHEARFLSANAAGDARGHLLYQQMMNITGITEGYTVTDNRWMTLNDEWRLTHPKNYSVKKLVVARKLAQKYKMNIVNTHGHFTTGTPEGAAVMRPAIHIIEPNTDNEHVAQVCEIGGLFDQEKLEYLNLVDATYPHLSPGFAIYDHGEVTIIDLEKYLGGEPA